MKIATIWGYDRQTPLFHTHHSFWEETMKEMGFEVQRYLWSEFMDMPGSADVHFFIDFHPALYKLEKGKFKNSVFYWNDSFHFPFAYTAQICERFDVSYFSEAGSALPLAQHGYQVKWLLAAFYPGLYRPLPDKKKVHDYGFIGQQDNVVQRKGNSRQGILASLALADGLRGYIGLGVYGETVNLVYNESRVLFDRTIWYNIGTRIFEVVGSGGFFLMNRLPEWSGLDMCGVDGKHFVIYDDSYADFEKKLRYYLEHEEERVDIAECGYRHFLANHTYKNRVEKILTDLHLT